MINPHGASLVHPSENTGQNKSVVGRYLNRTKKNFCIGWDKASGAATAEEHKNQVSDNMGDKGNWTPERSVSEARLLYHPQRRRG